MHTLRMQWYRVAVLSSAVLLAFATPASASGGINITPNSSLPGTTLLESLVGGFLTFMDLVCVAALISAAGAWAWGSHSGNYKISSQGRSGMIYALVALVVLGSVNVLANWALHTAIGLG